MTPKVPKKLMTCVGCGMRISSYAKLAHRHGWRIAGGEWRCKRCVEAGSASADRGMPVRCIVPRDASNRNPTDFDWPPEGP